MSDAHRDLATVVGVADGLAALGPSPVLVGGMALVVLGSQRVTADFDFLLAHPAEKLDDVVNLLYDRGFELVSRVGETGAVLATIDNRRVAATRLRLDKPSSAFFFDPATSLRIDMLFDFPSPARGVAERGTTRQLGAHAMRVASADDLLRLKRIAREQRSFAGDTQDIEFLRALLRSTPGGGDDSQE